MKKYRCPTCGNVFETRHSHCPKCNQELHYFNEVRVAATTQNENASQEVQTKEESAPLFIFNDDKIINSGIDELLDANHMGQNKKSTPIEDDDDFDPNASYFDGRLIQRIGYRILGFLLFVITLGLGFPWATCLVYRWEIKHTVIEGKRLTFDGKGSQLFGRYMLWAFLCIITLFIFTLWLVIFIKKWKTKHTHFVRS